MPKIAIVVAYPSTTPDGNPGKFDWDHYWNVHMPMVDKNWGPYGCKGWDVKKCDLENSPGGAKPPYMVLTTTYWDSLDDMRKAISTPESVKQREDIANFTDVKPVILVTDVVAQKEL